jgi:hypothetical protein
MDSSWTDALHSSEHVCATVGHIASWRLRQLVRVAGDDAAIVRARAHAYLNAVTARVIVRNIAEAHEAVAWRIACNTRAAHVGEWRCIGRAVRGFDRASRKSRAGKGEPRADGRGRGLGRARRWDVRGSDKGAVAGRSHLGEDALWQAILVTWCRMPRAAAARSAFACPPRLRTRTRAHRQAHAQPSGCMPTLCGRTAWCIDCIARPLARCGAHSCACTHRHCRRSASSRRAWSSRC